MVNGSKKLLILFLMFFLCTLDCYSSDIKISDIAGSFYSKNKLELSGQIDLYLHKAIVKDIQDTRILISPHAGYIYSGQVAAYGYKTLIGKNYDFVIVIGASHKNDFSGFATGDWQYYRTPLKDTVIDQSGIKRIMEKTDLLKYDNEVFLNEHSVDVQIPFLQKVLPSAKIIPILTGRVNLEEIKSLSKALNEAFSSGEKETRVLIIASTDLSHYLSYDEAYAIDKNTIENIENKDIDEFEVNLQEQKIQLCSEAPVMIAMDYAKEHNFLPRILNYANSGDVVSDKNRVVGYVSLSFVKDDLRKEFVMFSKEQKKRLLEIARTTIESYLAKRQMPKLEDKDPALIEEKGAFVTLRKGPELRGCIGNIYPTGKLNRTISEMAIASSTEDPRFPPVSLEELKDINIEISVLSVPKLISDPKDIILGTHGVIVKNGFNSGVFLPQVAAETGWSKEEFMNNLCEHKANLPKDAWKNSRSTKIYIFTAEVFSEMETQ